MTASKPNWLYRIASIDHLSEIQNEFYNIFTLHYTTIFKDFVPDLLRPIEKQLIIQHAPAFIQFLKNINLYDRWEVTQWATTFNSKHVVHLDKPNYVERCFALNIPVLNCSDSYTVWYDVDLEDTVMGLIAHYPTVPAYSNDSLKGELGRMSADQAAWINVAYPHRPETNHVEPRLVVSTRFTPEIFDVIDELTK